MCATLFVSTRSSEACHACAHNRNASPRSVSGIDTRQASPRVVARNLGACSREYHPKIKGVRPLLVKKTQVPNPVNNASRDKRSARLVSGPLNLKKIVRGRCSVSAVFRFFAEQFELGV